MKVNQSSGNVIKNSINREPDVNIYPVPFRESVTFSLSLQRTADIQLTIFDITGRKMTEVYYGYLKAGQQTIIWNRQNLSSGSYFYELRIKSDNQLMKPAGKLLLLDY
jgi:hypothetical protein